MITIMITEVGTALTVTATEGEAGATRMAHRL
jgi:hypothetical protein